MKNHTIDQYELPEPLIQFTRAKCDPDTVRTWTEKTPKQFPGSFEYDTLDGRFLATPENVRTFVHLCLGLRAIESLDSGCLEFINPKTGTKHPYKRVYSTVNAYFQHRCQKSVKKHFDITFKREAWRFRYSALHALGYLEEWDGIPRVDKYIDLLEWDTNYLPPVTLKEDGTHRSGQEWKRYALRTWLVNIWMRMLFARYGRPANPKNPMIILCSDQMGAGRTKWIKGLVGNYAKESMVITNHLEKNKQFIQLTRTMPIFFLDEMERLIKNEKTNIYLNHITYPESGYEYRKITSFIGIATNPQLAELGNRSSRRVILHVRKAEYADQMPPLNLPQFWAEVKHLVETMEPEEFSFAPLKKNIWEYNTYA